MFRRSRSIRQKIVRSYICSFAFILLIATIIFANLILVRERMSFYTVISDLLETTLEIRRFEKNYFLYRKQHDFFETLSYISSSEDLIQANREKIDGLFPFDHSWLKLIGEGQSLRFQDTVSEKLTGMLSEYRELFEKDFSGKTPSRQLEEKIRRKGHEITEIAEELSRGERKNIESLLTIARTSLVTFVAIFLLANIIIGRLIVKSIINPLKEMEKNMRKITSGNFEMLSLDSRDNEIISINSAFNRMLRELFDQRQEIIRSEKMASLGTMLAGIAHEINNPLSNISTSSEILNEELSSNDTAFKKELVGQIVNETDRARDIIRTVLEFTREHEFEKNEVDLLTTLNETMLFIRGDLPPYVAVEIDIPEKLTIFADKQKIQQAFLNLLKNAVDAISDKGEEGAVKITAQRKDGNHTEVRVSDTGKGIPKPLLHKIFDPFFTTKDVGAGTGLGLYLTHHIIEQHHGSIKAESEIGRGTTFFIKLPTQGTDNEKQG